MLPQVRLQRRGQLECCRRTCKQAQGGSRAESRLGRPIPRRGASPTAEWGRSGAGGGARGDAGAAAATAGSSARREALAAHLSPREGTQQMGSTSERGASPPKDGPPATHTRPSSGRQGGKREKMGVEKMRAEAGDGRCTQTISSSLPRSSHSKSLRGDPPEYPRIPAWDIQGHLREAPVPDARM